MKIYPANKVQLFIVDKVIDCGDKLVDEANAAELWDIYVDNVNNQKYEHDLLEAQGWPEGEE